MLPAVLNKCSEAELEVQIDGYYHDQFECHLLRSVQLQDEDYD